MLRGYMHGFFMEMKLYNKLRAVSKPFEYEEHRNKTIQAKIDEKRESRIIAQKRLPKINRDLAGKMMQSSGKSGGTGDDEDEEGTGGEVIGEAAALVLGGGVDEPHQQEKRHHGGDEIGIGDLPGATVVSAFDDLFLADHDAAATALCVLVAHATPAMARQGPGRSMGGRR